MQHAWVESEPRKLKPEEQRTIRKDFGKQVSEIVRNLVSRGAADTFAEIVRPIGAQPAFASKPNEPELWQVRSRVNASVRLVFWIDVKHEVVWLVLAYKWLEYRAAKRRAVALARVGDIKASFRGR